MRAVKDCCEIRSDIPERQRRVLQIVLGINLAMFVLELVAGLAAHSTALIADSVDMLGDAIVYGFSLFVVARGAVWQARAALLKGTIMAASGAGILGEVGSKIARDLVPAVDLMTGVGLAALVANSSVLALLWRHRGDDVNMRSAWLCSRNDVAGNAGVLLAALGVWLSGTAWPDIVIGLLIAGVFAGSAIGVIREAWRQLQAAPAR